MINITELRESVAVIEVARLQLSNAIVALSKALEEEFSMSIRYGLDLEDLTASTALITMSDYSGHELQIWLDNGVVYAEQSTECRWNELDQGYSECLATWEDVDLPDAIVQQIHAIRVLAAVLEGVSND